LNPGPMQAERPHARGIQAMRS